MEVKLISIIGDIKDRTGIDITVYDMSGEIVTSTSPVPAGLFPLFSTEKFKDGIFIDTENKKSYFLFSTPFNIFMGMINGCDNTVSNYALMISSMIENALQHSDDSLNRQECLKQFLTGDASHSKIQKIIRKFSSLNNPCYVFSIICESSKIPEVINFLEQLAGDSDDTAVLAEEDLIAYLRYMESEIDYQSALDFAEMMLENIEQELSIKVKIGLGNFSKNAFELANAFSQGSNAVRMGIATSSKGRIFSYKEFIMTRMIEDIPKATLNKYLEILLDPGAKDILNDPEMLNTAEEFLANSLNISETSRLLYMHRNTLMYRLDKIEKSMGLNIRRFSDAVTFRLILILYNHLKY